MMGTTKSATSGNYNDLETMILRSECNGLDISEYEHYSDNGRLHNICGYSGSDSSWSYYLRASEFRS